MTRAKLSVFPTRRAFIGAGVIAGSVWAMSYRPAPDPPWLSIRTGAPWAPRDGAGLLVHDNRLWILGGSAKNIADLSDAWSTANGTDWLKESGNTGWTKASEAMAVVFGGRMWRMGGFIENENGGFEPTNEVWSSTDGRAWTIEASAPDWEARGGGTLEVFNGKMWLLGGTSHYRNGKSETLFGDVWSTDDGTRWKKLPDSPGWAPRAFHSSVVHDGRLWVMGGGLWAKTPILNRDVWSTHDGTNWKQHSDRASWQGRLWSTAASYRGLLWVMGGYVSSPPGGSSDIWYSDNGKNWFPYLASRPSWTPRLAHSAIVFEEKLWVLAGSNGDYFSDIWSLDLRESWNKHTTLKELLRPIYVR